MMNEAYKLNLRLPDSREFFGRTFTCRNSVDGEIFQTVVNCSFHANALHRLANEEAFIT